MDASLVVAMVNTSILTLRRVEDAAGQPTRTLTHDLTFHLAANVDP